MKSRICPICKEEFMPHSGKQLYCKKPIEKKCPVCGDIFTTYCGPKAPTTCSKSSCKKAAGTVCTTTKICRTCGEPFVPSSWRQLDCHKPVKRTCIICGNEFTTKCGFTSQTCENPKCKNKFARSRSIAYYQKETKICIWCGKEFHPTGNTQVLCPNSHYRTCKVCGKEFEVPVGIVPGAAPQTCSKECRNSLKHFPPMMPELINKAIETKRNRYGEDWAKYIWAKANKTLLRKTGYSSPAKNPAIRKKSIAHARYSSFEKRIANLLDNYKIEYISHYSIVKGDISHEFDFYLPKYKILIDADGLYYHSYISDPDGRHVLDKYDDVRLQLIPSDHIFHIIVENQEEHDIKELTRIISEIDSGIFNYDSELFKWCRSQDFPYPEYNTERVLRDYKHLCEYNNPIYTPYCKLGMSIISSYHKSIYSCHVGDNMSPVEGWYDDDVLKKVIVNRLIYQNDVDPSKVLRGLYISKLAPRVSIFNPVLAKYLISKYLNEYDTIFDPFSGFSGRLLGVCSLGKKYIGQDLNENAVLESNQIISLLNLNANITQQDILESTGDYDCLITCPPYNNKEIYNNETVFKSCDNWIDECLTRFKCKHYVFVVDKTEKYKNNVVETLNTSTYFNSFAEYVIYI